MKNNKNNSVRRSIARGAGARGTSGVTYNGKDAYSKARKSNRGHYRVEFTNVFENMTDKDVELRKIYGLDLVSENLGVPADMLTLKIKKKSGEQTLTSLDEVFYVRLGKETCGKLSIRTQRLRKSTTLIFVFQVKKTALKPPQKAYSRKVGYKRKTASQRSETNRKSYRNRRGGTD